jgi:hypothetical protein
LGVVAAACFASTGLAALDLVLAVVAGSASFIDGSSDAGDVLARFVDVTGAALGFAVFTASVSVAFFVVALGFLVVVALASWVEDTFAEALVVALRTPFSSTDVGDSVSVGLLIRTTASSATTFFGRPTRFFTVSAMLGGQRQNKVAFVDEATLSTNPAWKQDASKRAFPNFPWGSRIFGELQVEFGGISTTTPPGSGNEAIKHSTISSNFIAVRLPAIVQG